MFPTIPQNTDLLKHLEDLLQAHRLLFKQERKFERMKGLVFGELFAIGRHTFSQILLVLGLVNEDWSAWYRFSVQDALSKQKPMKCFLKNG